MVYGFSGPAPWTLVSPVLLCCTVVQILSSVKWKRFEWKVNSTKLLTSREHRNSWNIMLYYFGERISRTQGSEMVTLWWRPVTGQCSPQSHVSTAHVVIAANGSGELQLISLHKLTTNSCQKGKTESMFLPPSWKSDHSYYSVLRFFYI